MDYIWTISKPYLILLLFLLLSVSANCNVSRTKQHKNNNRNDKIIPRGDLVIHNRGILTGCSH